MQIVTVGSRYQIVIPKEIRKKVQVRPGDKVEVSAQDESTVKIKAEPKSWVERTRGIAKEAWKGIDTTKYLEELRNEWDRQS